MAILAIGGDVLAVARVGVGVGGADGVFGGLCEVANPYPEGVARVGVVFVGGAVLGQTSGGGGTTIAVVADRGAGWWGDRRSGGVDGDGGRDFFDAVDAGAELGQDENGVGGVGGIYFAKFDRGVDGKLAIGWGVAGDDGGIVFGGDDGRGDRVLLGGLAIVGFGDQTGVGWGVGGGGDEIAVGVRGDGGVLLGLGMMRCFA